MTLSPSSHVYTPGVEMIPVTAFRLEPLVPPGQHPGHLTVDGELLTTATIQVYGELSSVLAMYLRQVPESTLNKEKSLVGPSPGTVKFREGSLRALIYCELCIVLAGLGAAGHGPHPRLMTG